MKLFLFVNIKVNSQKNSMYKDDHRSILYKIKTDISHFTIVKHDFKLHAITFNSFSVEMS